MKMQAVLKPVMCQQIGWLICQSRWLWSLQRHHDTTWRHQKLWQPLSHRDPVASLQYYHAEGSENNGTLKAIWTLSPLQALALHPLPWCLRDCPWRTWAWPPKVLSECKMLSCSTVLKGNSQIEVQRIPGYEYLSVSTHLLLYHLLFWALFMLFSPAHWVPNWPANGFWVLGSSPQEELDWGGPPSIQRSMLCTVPVSNLSQWTPSRQSVLSCWELCFRLRIWPRSLQQCAE